MVSTIVRAFAVRWVAGAPPSIVSAEVRKEPDRCVVADQNSSEGEELIAAWGGVPRRRIEQVAFTRTQAVDLEIAYRRGCVESARGLFRAAEDRLDRLLEVESSLVIGAVVADAIDALPKAT